MIEITKDNINYGQSVDMLYEKRIKRGVIKNILNENQILKYLYGAFFIFTIVNTVLIYNFFTILSKIN